MMNPTAVHTTHHPAPSRSTIAVALAMAALATAAVVFESGAVNHPAPARAPLAVQALLDQAPPAAGPAVDWSRVADAPITPAETVGAYER